ncbi:WXG100 family type VII secretion target [Streptomyces oryzae]|uniref:WXG100 family type VII secretion target n=1 Tax=Streptomyces oryzae TaxID=1434886 RepID=A0ABS3X4L8_9ACTN|nr:WXG100 family type VII secretion target [Streptomyces oryzae]MBO8190324.1 WXG100 family type VII secretion target [Streptomyces oryzae]
MGDQSISVGGVQYRVTPEYLSTASTNAQTTADNLARELAQIKNYVLSLEADWQGIAHNQFQILMQEYDTYARMLHDALYGISQGLRGNYVNYKESEEQNLANLLRLGEDVPRPPSGSNIVSEPDHVKSVRPVADFS